MNIFMEKATREALKGILMGDGGPFGTVIVKDGKIIAVAHNEVLKRNDPTCHGEINAIRKACTKLGTFDLTGCELYTTGEPCTMCLCACLWANISRIWYACSIADNAYIGFRDEKFDNMFCRNVPAGYLMQIDRDDVFKNLFQYYINIKNNKKY